MILWVLAAILAAATALVLALTGRRAPPVAASSGAALNIYKDQLAETERDLQQGLLKPEEAEGQKAEIGRRLLAASRDGGAAAGNAGRALPMAMVLLVPLLAFALYALRGQPQLPDVPRATRIAMAQQTGDVEGLLVQVEEHLKKKPDDVTGWKLLVPSYMSLGRYNDAAAAITSILNLEPPTAGLLADLSEALTLANQGLMTDSADKAAAEALKLDAKNPKALYYDAMSTLQKGNREGARAKFEALLAMAPANAPWRAAVEEQVRALAGTASAGSQTPDERMAMIRAMVEGLDARLAGNGDDMEGWLQLIRARAVLGEPDKARAALAKARAIFASNGAAMASLDALARELNL